MGNMNNRHSEEIVFLKNSSLKVIYTVENQFNKDKPLRLLRVAI